MKAKVLRNSYTPLSWYPVITYKEGTRSVLQAATHIKLNFSIADKHIMVVVRNDSAVALNWRLFTPGCLRQALHRLFDDFREEEEAIH